MTPGAVQFGAHLLLQARVAAEQCRGLGYIKQLGSTTVLSVVPAAVAVPATTAATCEMGILGFAFSTELADSSSSSARSNLDHCCRGSNSGVPHAL